jgi:hypothetical protein
VNDTPYQSIYTFRLEGVRHVAANGLVPLLQELIVFQSPPLKLIPAEFSIDAGPVSTTVLYFNARTVLRSPYEGVRDVHISGGTDGRDWYISMIVPKVYQRRTIPSRY